MHHGVSDGKKAKYKLLGHSNGRIDCIYKLLDQLGIVLDQIAFKSPLRYVFIPKLKSGLGELLATYASKFIWS